MSNWFSKGYWTAFTVWAARDEARMPYWPLERVVTIQQQRLSRMVDHAYNNVPFYREAMDRVGLRPNDIRSAQDLVSLPIVTKEDLFGAQNAFQALHSAGEPRLRIESSGTSGRSHHVVHDATSLFLSLAHGQRQRTVLRSFAGRLTGYREMIMARAKGVPRQIRNFYERHSFQLPGVELTRSYLPLLHTRLAEQVDRINEFRPTVIRGYGSLIGSLFRRIVENGLEVVPPKAFVEAVRTHVERNHYDVVLPMNDYTTIALTRQRRRLAGAVATALPPTEALESGRPASRSWRAEPSRRSRLPQTPGGLLSPGLQDPSAADARARTMLYSAP